MYDYIDTTTNIALEGNKPSEAMAINGAYLEDLIPGYRTLSVKGRESLSAELKTERYGKRDGAYMVSRSYPERHITVQYQLMSESPEAFREAYNILTEVLDTENAHIAFDDEKDKYFIGTPSTIGDIEPGTDSVTGTIEIVCMDPHKYASEMMYAVLEGREMTDEEQMTGVVTQTIVINNSGNRPVHPVITVRCEDERDVVQDKQHYGKQSFISNIGCVSGIVCQTDKAMLRFGNLDLKYPMNTAVCGPGISGEDSAWDGVTIPDPQAYKANVYSIDGQRIDGAMHKAFYNGLQYYGPYKYGDSETPETYGPTLLFGAFSAKNFAAQCELLFMLGEIPYAQMATCNEQGSFTFAVLGPTVSGKTKEIAKVVIDKASAGNKAVWTAQVGEQKQTGEITLNDRYFALNTVDSNQKVSNYKTVRKKGKISDNLIQIKRVGERVYIYLCGKELAFTDTTAGAAESKATQILFQFGAKTLEGYAGKNIYPNNISTIALRKWRFCSLSDDANIDDLIQLPTSTVLRIDTENCDYTIDSGHQYKYGDLENDFENFVIEPGIHSMSVTSYFRQRTSECKTPTVLIGYTERWL